MANQQNQQRQDKDVDMNRDERGTESMDDARGMDADSDRDIGMRGDQKGR